MRTFAEQRGVWERWDPEIQQRIMEKHNLSARDGASAAGLGIYDRMASNTILPGALKPLLVKYFIALRRVFMQSQSLSLSFDGSRVGAKDVLISAAWDRVTGKAGWAPCQVPRISL